MKAIIITGGHLDDGFTYGFIKNTNYDMLIAVDRGLLFFDKRKMNPDYIVGDFDSIPQSVLDKFKRSGKSSIQAYSPQKDETDTELAMLLALQKGCDTIYLLGATGNRLDHVLGNIELLGFALKQEIECFLIDPNNRIRLIKDRTVLKKTEQFGDYVSLLPYTPIVEGIYLYGFKYLITDYTMSRFYLEDAKMLSGISNEITDDEAVIELKQGILMLIEARD